VTVNVGLPSKESIARKSIPIAAAADKGLLSADLYRAYKMPVVIQLFLTPVPSMYSLVLA